MRLVLLAMLAPGMWAQTDPPRKFVCKDATTCEMREQTVTSTGEISVEGLENGPVLVQGWDGTKTLVRLRVEAHAVTVGEVQDLFRRIRTTVEPGRVMVDGPRGLIARGWLVSAEVYVPRATNLRLETNNGAIEIADLTGNVNTRSHNAAIHVDRIRGSVRAVSNNSEIRVTGVSGDADFETNNGAMKFSGIGGSARGKTNNGHIELGLDGEGSPGRSIDLETHNAAVELTLPREFSAEVLFESHHGQLKSDFPAPPRNKKVDDDIRSFRIGGGAAKIRVKTNNGSVKLRAK
ncbi:MAG: hypothetical protein RL328_1401 [Acidobacteriota bacterium]